MRALSNQAGIYILLLRSLNVVHQLKQRRHHDTMKNISFPRPEIRRRMGGHTGGLNDRNMVRSLNGQRMLHARTGARRRPGGDATLRPQAGPAGVQGDWKRGGRRG